MTAGRPARALVAASAAAVAALLAAAPPFAAAQPTPDPPAPTEAPATPVPSEDTPPAPDDTPVVPDDTPVQAAPCRQPPPPGGPPPAGRDPLIARLGLDQAWQLSTGAGTAVAVVDTGVDGRHAELAGSLLPGVELVPTGSAAGSVELDGGTEDCDGHGTAVAGLVTGDRGDDRVVGTAPDAGVVPVRFGVEIAQAPDELIASAIRAGAERASVLNLSFALPVDRPLVRDAVREAVARDVVVVAAAGNENQSQPGGTWYPAAYDGVLAVAAVDASGTPTSDSNPGPWVDLAAPGTDLAVPSASGDGYTTTGGTSFATALVSGAAALVRSRFPELPAAAVAARLVDTAVPVAGGRTDATGAGVLDPYAALTAVGAAPQADPAPAAVDLVPLPPPDGGLPGGAALAWAAGLVTAAALLAAAAAAVRRGTARAWRTGPLPAPDPPDRPPAAAPDVALD